MAELGSRTYILVTDVMGKQLGVVSSFQTNKDVNVLTQELTKRIKQVLADYGVHGLPQD